VTIDNVLLHPFNSAFVRRNEIGKHIAFFIDNLGRGLTMAGTQDLLGHS